MNHDQPSDIMQLTDKSLLDVLYIQVPIRASPHILLAIKGSRLPRNIVETIDGMIGLRLHEASSRSASQ